MPISLRVRKKTKFFHEGRAVAKPYNHLKRLAKQKGLTQKRIAQLMRVGETTVHNWFSGYRMPKAHEISALSTLLDTDVTIVTECLNDARPAD